MGLIHWWPLNGDTKDYGLNPIDLTNNGMTIDNNGKIGKCYKSGAAGKMTATDSSLAGMRKISVSMWFRVDNATASNFVDIWHLGTFRAETFYNSTALWTGYSDSKFSISRGYSLQLENKWMHIVQTLDVDAGIYTLYFDGTKSTDTFTDDGTQYVGSSFQLSDTNFEVSYNDVRIYDHVLSQKEVNELRKALVLHYDFEDMESNLLSGNFGANLYVSIDNTTHPFPGMGNIYKISTSGNSSNVYKGFAEDITSLTTPGESITLSFWIYCENKDNVDQGNEFRVYRTYSDGTSTSWGPTVNWKSTYVNNTWMHYSLTYVLESNSTGRWFNMNVVRNGTVWLAGMKVEHGDKATPFTGYRNTSNTTVYDSSGYNYNGDSSSSTEAPVIYSGGPSGLHYMKLPLNGFVRYANHSFDKSDNFSYSVWIRHHGRNGTSTTYAFTNGRADGTHWGWGVGINDNGYHIHYGDNSKTITVAANEWHLLTVTISGKTQTIYLDGIQNTSGTCTTLPTYEESVGLGLGSFCYSNNPKLYPSNCDFADFKIFATALSAADVKAEYNRKAAIDRSGNLFTGEIIEDPDTEDLLFGTYIGEGGYYVRGGSASNLYNDEDGNMVIRDHTWIASPFFKINPGEYLQFDAIVIGDENSESIRNGIYIGFEKYDENGNTGENELCSYYRVGHPETYQEHTVATVNTISNSTTRASTTASLWRVRILNAWNSSTDSNNSLRVLKIRHLTLRRIPSYKQNINKNNTVLANTVHENPYTDKTSMYKNGVLRTAGIREL